MYESIYMLYLHQDKGLSSKQIMRCFTQFSKATVCWHMKRPINHNVFDKWIKNPGRTKKLNKAWWREYYTGSKPFKNFIGSFTRNNSEPTLASPIQFQFGPYPEYLTDMVTVIYNHARKVCWQAKTLTKEWSLLDKWNTYNLTFGNAT